MNRKKEWIIGILFIILGISFNAFFYLKDNKKEESIDEPRELRSPIRIKIDGEIARNLEMIYVKPLTYGALFLRIEYALNEFSDISSFPLEQSIDCSLTITIPTKDLNNHYTPTSKIYIPTATLEELMSLPQIGEKRGKKIMDYLDKNGSIDSWETFFKIASIPEHAQAQIMQQAIL